MSVVRSPVTSAVSAVAISVMGGGAVKTPEQKLDDALEAERLAGNLVAWHEYYNPARFGSPSVGSSLTGMTISDRTAAGNDAVASGAGPMLRQTSGMYYTETNGTDDALTMALPARRNLLTYTEDFSNGVWGVAANSFETAVASGGLVNGISASFLEEKDALTGNKQTSQSFTFSATSHTYSAYVRPVDRTWCRLMIYDGTSFHTAYFNVADGATGANSAGVASTITNAGGGVFRLTMTVTTAAGSGGAYFMGALADSGTDAYTGEAGKGYEVGGAQLETGSTASDYQSIGSGWMDDMMVSIAFRTSDTQAVLAGFDTSAAWMFAFRDGNAGPSVSSNAGAPTFRLNGAAATYATFDAAHDGVAGENWNVLTIVGADISSRGSIVLGDANISGWEFDGDIVGLVIAPNTAENIELAEAALAKAMEPVGYALAA